MLHMISARCVARNLHTTAPGPECKCWRQFTAQWGDCQNSWTAPLDVIIIIIIIIITIIIITTIIIIIIITREESVPASTHWAIQVS